MEIPEGVEAVVFETNIGTKTDIASLWQSIRDTRKCPHCGGPLCSPGEYYSDIPGEECIEIVCARRQWAEEKEEEYSPGCLKMTFYYHFDPHDPEADPTDWERFKEYVLAEIIAALETDEALRVAGEAVECSV